MLSRSPETAADSEVAPLIRSPQRLDWENVLKSQSMPKFDDSLKAGGESPSVTNMPTVITTSKYGNVERLKELSPVSNHGSIGVVHCVWHSTSGPTPIFTWYDINETVKNTFVKEVIQSICALMKDPMSHGTCVRVNANRVEISHRFEGLLLPHTSLDHESPTRTSSNTAGSVSTTSTTAHGVCAYIKVRSKQDTRHILRCALELRKRLVSLATLYQKLTCEFVAANEQLPCDLSTYEHELHRLCDTIRACICCGIPSSSLDQEWPDEDPHAHEDIHQGTASRHGDGIASPQPVVTGWTPQGPNHGSIMKFSLFVILHRRKKLVIHSNHPMKAIELYDSIKAVLPSTMHSWCCRLPLNEILPNLFLQATTVSMQEVKVHLSDGEYVFDVDTSKMYTKERSSLRQVATENNVADRFCDQTGLDVIVQTASHFSVRWQRMYLYNLWRFGIRLRCHVVASWLSSHAKNATTNLSTLIQKPNCIVSEFLMKYSEQEFSYIRHKLKDPATAQKKVDLVKNFI